MDFLTFISSIIGSLAWPATLVGLLFMAFRHGKTIAKFVQSIRYKDLELTLRSDFDKAMNIAESIRATLRPDIQFKDDMANLRESDTLKIANIDPALAIHKSWQKLEAKLIQLIQHNGLIRFITPPLFIQRLRELGKLTKDEEELYKRLRSIRNQAVHPYHFQRRITMTEAMEYDQLIETLCNRLEQIRQEPEYVSIDFAAYDKRVKEKEQTNGG